MPFLIDNLNCGRVVKSVVSRLTTEPYLGKASSHRCSRRDAGAMKRPELFLSRLNCSTEVAL